jgi:hypothetical protein
MDNVQINKILKNIMLADNFKEAVSADSPTSNNTKTNTYIAIKYNTLNKCKKFNLLLASFVNTQYFYDNRSLGIKGLASLRS